MSSKSSKMIGWIKKRCRRRSDTFGEKLRYVENKTEVDSVYYIMEINVSESTHKHVFNCEETEDHIYEEISHVIESDGSRDMIAEISRMTKVIQEEFTDNVNNHSICPICRRSFHLEELCTCTDTNCNDKMVIQEENVYELAINPLMSQSKRDFSKKQNRKLPDLPTYLYGNKTNVDNTTSDDSSGYYESVESDYYTDQYYRPGSEESDVLYKHNVSLKDDGYEEIDLKPRILAKRRCSLDSASLAKSVN